MKNIFWGTLALTDFALVLYFYLNDNTTEKREWDYCFEEGISVMSWKGKNSLFISDIIY